MEKQEIKDEESKKKVRRNFKKEVEELEKKNKEFVNDLQRLQAEFENFSKKVEKEKESFREYAKADLIKKLLTVLDSFDGCLKGIKNEDDLKGIKMIHDQLLKILKEEGLEEIKSLNEKFNHDEHEVMMKVNGNEEEDKIIEEVQKGYKIKGKTLRYAKVNVSGGKEK